MPAPAGPVQRVGLSDPPCSIDREGYPVPDELAVFDDMGSLARLAWLGGLLLLLGLGRIVVLVVAREFYWVAWALAVLMTLLGGGLLAQLRPRLARRGSPFLVITSSGVRCPGLVDPLVPWSAVERILVNDAEAVCTTFFLRPEAALPVTDGSRGNVRVLRGRRALAIAGPKPRGMTVEAFGARLQAAAQAARGTAEREG